ncbi:transient receptor potential cation channel subfamily V member 6-like [Haliotis rufescens]|uniref:transient receptor potential cation channel subfamily V member 6-like n=1 Tax=Haliotis rufescens TaxID=6454 RepID=UPI00201EEAAE|nr:transient receptor potential cation channel subfamily V member 6-like [Haliotis rufescens]
MRYIHILQQPLTHIQQKEATTPMARSVSTYHVSKLRTMQSRQDVNNLTRTLHELSLKTATTARRGLTKAYYLKCIGVLQMVQQCMCVLARGGHVRLWVTICIRHSQDITICLKVVELTSMATLDEKMWRKTTKKNEIDVLCAVNMSSDVQFTFDAGVENKNKNTILHCITVATVLKENKQYYIELFDTILEAYIQWKLRSETQDSAEDVRYRAIQHITTGVENNQKLSVLHLALKKGCVDISKKILQMENINCFNFQKGIREYRDRKRVTGKFYDVTHILPLGTWKPSQEITSNRVEPEDPQSFMTNFGRPKHLHVLMNFKTLDLDPVKEIISIYGSVIYWIYMPWTLMHVLHISFFTYTGISLLGMKLDAGNTQSGSGTLLEGVLYFLVPLEPALFFFWFIYTVISLSIQAFRYSIGSSSLIPMLSRTIFSIFNFGYCVLVFVFLDAYRKDGPDQHILLSITLSLGWLMTLEFARGFQQFHYFQDIVWFVVFSLVTFMLVCVIFLLAFTCAFHVQIQLTSSGMSFGSSMFKLFQALIGEDAIFSDEFEASIAKFGGSVVYLKIMFIFYSILCTIIFLNFVIATVNDVYSALVKHKRHLWASHSLMLGVYLHLCLPWLVNMVIKRKIKHGPLGTDLGLHTGVRWFVAVPDVTRGTGPETDILEQVDISQRLDKIEERLHKLETVTRRLDKIDDSLQRIIKSIRPDE